MGNKGLNSMRSKNSINGGTEFSVCNWEYVSRREINFLEGKDMSRELKVKLLRLMTEKF